MMKLTPKYGLMLSWAEAAFAAVLFTLLIVTLLVTEWVWADSFWLTAVVPPMPPVVVCCNPSNG